MYGCRKLFAVTIVTSFLLFGCDNLPTDPDDFFPKSGGTEEHSPEGLRRIKADIAMCKDWTSRIVDKPDLPDNMKGVGYEALYKGCMQDKGYVWKETRRL